MRFFIGVVLTIFILMFAIKTYKEHREEIFFKEYYPEFLSVRQNIATQENHQEKQKKSYIKTATITPKLYKAGFQRVFIINNCIVFQKTIGAMSTNFEIWNCPNPLLDEDRTLIKKMDKEWYLVQYSQ